MPQAHTDNNLHELQGYPALGLINTHADEAKRAEYPILKVVHHAKSGRLYAHEPGADADLGTLRSELEQVEPGDDFGLTPMTQWAHTNGSVYLCHGVAAVLGSLRSTHPLLVIYQDYSNGKLWGKSIKRFLQGMTQVTED